ncbi:MAG: DUF2125 domain-containing protein [Pseudomonadota bacterium]
MSKWALILVVIASALWSGWWFVGARSTEAAVTQGLAEMEIQGWRIERENLSVAGFPNRFDVTLTEPRISAPDGWTLAAPILRAFALSYRPNHIIAVAPPQMTVTHPLAGAIDIANADLRASVIVTPSTRPVLDRATIAADTLQIAGAEGAITLAGGQIATRQAAGPTVHDLAINFTDMTAPGFDGLIETLDVDATITLDRAIGSGDPARLDSLNLRSASIAWGDVRATLSGDMSVMFDGTPRGVFALRLTGWEPFLDRAVAAGVIPEGQAPLVAAGLRGLVDETGEATVPVALEDGFLLVLGFPVTTVPRLPVPGR